MQPSLTLLKSSCLSDSMAPALHSADSSVPSMVAQPGLSCMPCTAAALSKAVQGAAAAGYCTSPCMAIQVWLASLAEASFSQSP